MSFWTLDLDASLNKGKVAYKDCIRLLFKFKRGVNVSDFCKNNRTTGYSLLKS